jgi:hypothetical protein
MVYLKKYRLESIRNQMKIKIFRSESSREIESDINHFLSDRKDIKVIDIREVDSQRYFIFMVLYEYMDKVS